MTTRAKKRKVLSDLEDENRRLNSDFNGLLDILNAILMAQGGKVVVSKAQLVAATRKQINVTHAPDFIVITAEGAEHEKDEDISKRLWLPGGQA